MSPLNFDPKNDGYWGDTTATLDWCEQNYEVSWYIAEFWNTVTNLSMIIPPLWGIYKCLQRGLETRYLVGFLALLLVGIGSTMFHMTLQYSMQLLDEIPMVWSSCAFIYCQHMVTSRSGEKGLGAAALLATYGTLFTVLYLAWPHPILHQVMYGVLVFYMIYQAMMILKEGYNKVSMKLFVLGILMYGCGFLLWNLGDYSTLIKFKSFHAPQKTSSVTMWKLCEVPCLHCWLQLLSSMAGGICVQVMQPT